MGDADSGRMRIHAIASATAAAETVACRAESWLQRVEPYSPGGASATVASINVRKCSASARFT